MLESGFGHRPGKGDKSHFGDTSGKRGISPISETGVAEGEAAIPFFWDSVALFRPVQLPSKVRLVYLIEWTEHPQTRRWSRQECL